MIVTGHSEWHRPEESLAAGHAGGFNHALANIAGMNDLVVESVRTAAEVTMSTDEHGPSIAAVHLTVDASVPGAPDEQFQRMAEAARKWCSFAKVLSVPITMHATRS
jgi:osmotically inducible protein OsmC